MSSPTFLYVEDDPMSCQVLQLLIEEMLGYPITIFENSEDFIERLHAVPVVPDVIFLDIHMAPYNGYEVLEMLRNDPDYQQVTVIAMTASVMAYDIEQLKAAGFDGLIAKPVRKRVFPELLERILAGESVWVVS